MSERTENGGWPALLDGLQAANERAYERQAQFLSELSGGRLPTTPGFDALNAGVATFKSRVQSGGRISIPDAEREALDIGEGDIVQTVLIPVTPRGGADDV